MYVYGFLYYVGGSWYYMLGSGNYRGYLRSFVTATEYINR